MYMKAAQAAKMWEISDRRVRILCDQGKIAGAYKEGKTWKIPENALKPKDGRYKVNLLREVEEKLIALAGKTPLSIDEEERLTEQFLIEYIYNSNAMEGSSLSLRDTDQVLRGLIIDSKPLNEHMEVLGQKEAFYYVRELTQKNTTLTKDLINEIHSFILADQKGDRGVYRRIPAKIKGGANKDPLIPYLIDRKMDELLNWYKCNKDHIVKKAAKFHLEFEAIHPYLDGNGRIGRLLINYVLMSHGYPPINIKFSDSIKYYDAFEHYYRKNSLEPMESLLAQYLNESLSMRMEVMA